MLDVTLDTLATPALHHHGLVFFTELVEAFADTTHYFGGDLDLTVAGLAHGPLALHRILTLDVTDKPLGLSGLRTMTQLPLVYGMRYDGFEYDYVVESGHAIQIKRSNQQNSSPNWPYEGYPDALPRFGLRLLPPVRASVEEFSSLTHQGLQQAEPDELAFIVPSIKDYGGVSLWGKWGWGVQMIFYFTPSDQRVWATNQID
jgi:hypothetical protein